MLELNLEGTFYALRNLIVNVNGPVQSSQLHTLASFSSEREEDLPVLLELRQTFLKRVTFFGGDANHVEPAVAGIGVGSQRKTRPDAVDIHDLNQQEAARDGQIIDDKLAIRTWIVTRQGRKIMPSLGNLLLGGIFDHRSLAGLQTGG